MIALQQVNEFLTYRRLALVGVSGNPKDFTRGLFREFVDRGYDVVPVHPGIAQIEGRPCFARVGAIDPPVESALLLTSPAVTEEVVRDCAAAGVRHVWMYRAAGAGAVSAHALAFCRENGINVIPGECPLMFFPRAAWFHRLHGWIRRITRSYPR